MRDHNLGNTWFSLVNAWGLAGLAVGAAFSAVSVLRNDSFRDVQTSLVFAAWFSAILMLLSVLAGVGARFLRKDGPSQVSGDQLADERCQSSDERGPESVRWLAFTGLRSEFCAACAAWLVFGAGLLAFESGVLVAHSRLVKVVVCVLTVVGGVRAGAAAPVFLPRFVTTSLMPLVLVAAVLVPAGGVGILIELAWQRAEDRDGATLSRQSSGLEAVTDRQVLFFGLDGADWRRVDSLIERGQMPHMKSLIARGLRSNLRSLQPTLSPVLWTTVATGDA